jgi:hypothetical protein
MGVFMARPSSLKQRFAKHARDVFVGRTEELALFERAVQATPGTAPFTILAISGPGGVGKSTLLKQYLNIAEQYGETLHANEDQPTVIDVLVKFSQQLGAKGWLCDSFDKYHRRLYDLMAQVRADPNAPHDRIEAGTKFATRFGLQLLKDVPIVGAAVSALREAGEDQVASRVDSLVKSYVINRFKDVGDQALFLDPETELTKYFLQCLNSCADNRQVVLFLDTYELTAPALETWLVRMIDEAFGRVSDRLLIVIAGRYPLSQRWTPFQGGIRHVSLEEFTEAEAKDYLARNGITDEKRVADLIRLSERLPVLLALLVSVPGDIPGDMAGSAVERFLQGTTEFQRDVALRASVPRYFDEDILQAIIGPERAKEAFDWLSQAHWVRAGERGWAYHDVVRTLMLRHLRLRTEARCHEVHSRMHEYFEAKAEELRLSEKARYSNEMWSRYTVERLYHAVSK